MFYLRTGANGSCKTLFTLRDIRDLQLETGRPVRFNKNFKAKPILTEEFGWKLIQDESKWELEPHGTIFLFDEAYKCWPVRPNGQQPPKHIERLAEHRSMGYDFFALCLHPSQIDSFVRKAIGPPGYHQHFKRVAGASNLTRVLQWDAVNDQCQKDGSGKSAQITNRMQPKEVYSWYDSAFIHTGKVRIPRQMWIFLGGLLVAAVLGFFALQAIKKNVFKGEAPPAAVDGVQRPMVIAPAGASQRAAAQAQTPMEYAASYVPRIPGLMHTAPVYDGLTAPKRVPVPAACIDSPSKGCKCFTQDATPYPIEQDVCRQVATGGIFLAFVDTSQSQQRDAKGGISAPGVSAGAVQSPAALSTAPLLAPPVTTSTVSRDAEVMAFMAKRREFK